MIEEITFDTGNNVIILTYGDGTTAIYTQAMATEYIADHPDRSGDLKAMGWMP